MESIKTLMISAAMCVAMALFVFGYAKGGELVFVLSPIIIGYCVPQGIGLHRCIKNDANIKQLLPKLGISEEELIAATEKHES